MVISPFPKQLCLETCTLVLISRALISTEIGSVACYAQHTSGQIWCILENRMNTNTEEENCCISYPKLIIHKS